LVDVSISDVASDRRYGPTADLCDPCLKELGAAFSRWVGGTTPIPAVDRDEDTEARKDERAKKRAAKKAAERAEIEAAQAAREH
jgi:hypothetical protein